MKTFDEIKNDLRPFTEEKGKILSVKIWISENNHIMCIEIDKPSFQRHEIINIKKYLKFNGFKLFEDGKNYLRKKP